MNCRGRERERAGEWNKRGVNSAVYSQTDIHTSGGSELVDNRVHMFVHAAGLPAYLLPCH